MTRASTIAPLLVRVGGGIGLAGLALITLISPGATRMYASPWSLAAGVALLVPALVLILRGFDRARPLALPGGGWTLAAAGGATVVLASALLSPHRGPSVRGSTPLLAGIAVFFILVDWLWADARRRETLHRVLVVAGAAIGVASVGEWIMRVAGRSDWPELRNLFPLGHSNYTAGLALLVLPSAAALVGRARAGWRWLAAGTVLLALVMLFTSGSRGGLLGLAAIAAGAVWWAPWARRAKGWLLLAAVAGALVVAVVHPRARAALFGGAGARQIAVSDVQRSAMFTAGLRMGVDRPALGWGPGTTPLVYPRYRGGLPGGAENVLQLHSLPVHLWAELGAAGLAGWLAFALLAGRGARRDPTAAVALLGYGVFALTDWQLDVPVFAGAIASLAALLAVPVRSEAAEAESAAWRSRSVGTWVGVGALAGLAVVAGWGRRDPAPELNVRALTLAQDPTRAEEAAALLRQSLALNPDQEIAHFNLGWLLLTRDPAAAAGHFRAAARLVPDKGGVYFGLGLARLNQGARDPAARLLALECLNDPAFLVSPWWREPAVAALREASAAAFAGWLRQVPAGSERGPELHERLLGRVPAGAERVYRRERAGYPVLMRDLDLGVPRDLYDVREPAGGVPAGLPAKGWLPGPLLLALLDAADSPKP